MRRISLFPTLQSILHFVESVTGRVEILSGKERSFFEVIQETLSKVSAETGFSFPTKQTLIVDVIEYLGLETGVSFQLQRSDIASLHSRSFIIASYSQEEERDQLKAIL